MVINATLEQTSATAGTVPTLPTSFIGASDQVYIYSDGTTGASATASGKNTVGQRSAKEDTTNGVYTRYTYEYVDVAGNVLAVGAAASNFVRYCEWPGQRLPKKVSFSVNGNPLII